MNAPRCILLVFVIVCATPAVSYADPFVLTTETMMEAQAHNALYIGHLFGADPSTVLRFTSNVDPTAGSFSFSLLPGQSYLGQPLSLTTVGSFDSTLGQYNWIISGQFGADSFSGTGSATWVGDPTGTVNSQITLGGKLFKITGTTEIESTVSNNTSTGIYFFRGPAGGPFAPYKGTDILDIRSGKWTHTVEVPKNPFLPSGQVIFTTGAVPFPNGGPGNFDVQILPTPEPTTFLLLGTGVAGVAMKLRKQLKTRKKS